MILINCNENKTELIKIVTHQIRAAMYSVWGVPPGVGHHSITEEKLAYSMCFPKSVQIQNIIV